MSDTTIKKVEAASSPRGEMGQKYLVAESVEPGDEVKHPTNRDYETVGYVISGRAMLELEGQTLSLKAGDSWLVPAGASHQYKILRTVHGCRGNLATSRGPWSRLVISLWVTKPLHLRSPCFWRLRPCFSDKATKNLTNSGWCDSQRTASTSRRHSAGSLSDRRRPAVKAN
jgi:hypothetical protein